MQDASGCEATDHGRETYPGYPPPQRGNDSTAGCRVRVAYVTPCAPLALSCPFA
jgi:hypothetical protein